VGDLNLAGWAFLFLTLLMVVRKAALTKKVKWSRFTIAGGDKEVIL
jgi:hypothetical protein